MMLFQRLRLTDEQLQALAQFNAEHGDSWAIVEVDFDKRPGEYLSSQPSGTLEISVYPALVHRQFTRYIAKDGTITRYDEDTDMDVPADHHPKVGRTRETGPNGASRFYFYNY